MSSYLNINELAQSPTFRGRVQAALAIAASKVLVEVDTPHAAKRRMLAESVLADPAPRVNSVIWTVVTNPAIQTAGMDAPDGDLEYVITQAWDRLAGVIDTDLTETAPL